MNFKILNIVNLILFLSVTILQAESPNIKIQKIACLVFEGEISFKSEEIFIWDKIDNAVYKITLNSENEVEYKNIEDKSILETHEFYANNPEIFPFNVDNCIDSLRISKDLFLQSKVLKHSILCKHLYLNLQLKDRTIDTYHDDCVGAIAGIFPYSDELFYVVILSQGGSGYSIAIDLIKLKYRIK